MRCPNCKNKISWGDIENTEPIVVYLCKNCGARMSLVNSDIKIVGVSVLIGTVVGVLSDVLISSVFFGNLSDILISSEAISLVVTFIIGFYCFIRMLKLEIKNDQK